MKIKNLKYFVIILAITLLFAVFCYVKLDKNTIIQKVSAVTELDGAGTENNPYLIHDKSEYELMVNTLNSTDDDNYKSSYFSIVNSFSIKNVKPIKEFHGKLRGNGNTLSGQTNPLIVTLCEEANVYYLNITGAEINFSACSISTDYSDTIIDSTENAKEYYTRRINYGDGSCAIWDVCGLIANVNYGYIMSVGVKDSKIIANADDLKYRIAIGGIVGMNFGTISNSFVYDTDLQAKNMKNSDRLDMGISMAGGVCGYLLDGLIDKCFTSLWLNKISATGAILGPYISPLTGGIFGLATNYNSSGSHQYPFMYVTNANPIVRNCVTDLDVYSQIIDAVRDEKFPLLQIGEILYLGKNTIIENCYISNLYDGIGEYNKNNVKYIYQLNGKDDDGNDLGEYLPSGVDSGTTDENGNKIIGANAFWKGHVFEGDIDSNWKFPSDTDGFSAGWPYFGGEMVSLTIYYYEKIGDTLQGIKKSETITFSGTNLPSTDLSTFCQLPIWEDTANKQYKQLMFYTVTINETQKQILTYSNGALSWNINSWTYGTGSFTANAVYNEISVNLKFEEKTYVTNNCNITKEINGNSITENSASISLYSLKNSDTKFTFIATAEGCKYFVYAFIDEIRLTDTPTSPTLDDITSHYSKFEFILPTDEIIINENNIPTSYTIKINIYEEMTINLFDGLKQTNNTVNKTPIHVIKNTNVMYKYIDNDGALQELNPSKFGNSEQGYFFGFYTVENYDENNYPTKAGNLKILTPKLEFDSNEGINGYFSDVDGYVYADGDLNLVARYSSYVGDYSVSFTFDKTSAIEYGVKLKPTIHFYSLNNTKVGEYSDNEFVFSVSKSCTINIHFPTNKEYEDNSFSYLTEISIDGVDICTSQDQFITKIIIDFSLIGDRTLPYSFEIDNSTVNYDTPFPTTNTALRTKEFLLESDMSDDGVVRDQSCNVYAYMVGEFNLQDSASSSQKVKFVPTTNKHSNIDIVKGVTKYTTEQTGGDSFIEIVEGKIEFQELTDCFSENAFLKTLNGKTFYAQYNTDIIVRYYISDGVQYEYDWLDKGTYLQTIIKPNGDITLPTISGNSKPVATLRGFKLVIGKESPKYYNYSLSGMEYNDFVIQKADGTTAIEEIAEIYEIRFDITYKLVNLAGNEMYSSEENGGISILKDGQILLKPVADIVKGENDNGKSYEAQQTNWTLSEISKGNVYKDGSSLDVTNTSIFDRVDDKSQASFVLSATVKDVSSVKVVINLLNIDDDSNLGTAEYRLYYNSTGTADSYKLYPGSAIPKSSINDYTFKGFMDFNTYVFVGGNSKIVNGKTLYQTLSVNEDSSTLDSSLKSGETITITAYYKSIDAEKVIVNIKCVNKYGGVVESERKNLYYNMSNQGDGNLYPESEISPLNVSDYMFGEWKPGYDTNVFEKSGNKLVVADQSSLSGYFDNFTGELTIEALYYSSNDVISTEEQAVDITVKLHYDKVHSTSTYYFETTLSVTKTTKTYAGGYQTSEFSVSNANVDAMFDNNISKVDVEDIFYSIFYYNINPGYELYPNKIDYIWTSDKTSNTPLTTHGQFADVVENYLNKNPTETSIDFYPAYKPVEYQISFVGTSETLTYTIENTFALNNTNIPSSIYDDIENTIGNITGGRGNAKYKIHQITSRGDEGTKIYSADGVEATVGDYITQIYQGSYGHIKIEIETDNSKGRSITFNYEIKIDTPILYEKDGDIISSSNIPESSATMQITQTMNYYNGEVINNQTEIDLKTLLKDGYSSSKPLLRDFEGANYYLAGWTFNHGLTISYNVYNEYAQFIADSQIYGSGTGYGGAMNGTHFKGQVEKNSGVYYQQQYKQVYKFLRNFDCSNYSSSDNLTYVIAYDGIISNINENLVLYPVWLPYHSVYINSTGWCDDEYTTHSVLNDYDYTIGYGLTLDNDFKIYFDNKTVFGTYSRCSAPTVRFENHILEGFTIGYNGFYYYDADNPINTSTYTKNSKRYTSYYYNQHNPEKDTWNWVWMENPGSVSWKPFNPDDPDDTKVYRHRAYLDKSFDANSLETVFDLNDIFYSYLRYISDFCTFDAVESNMTFYPIFEYGVRLKTRTISTLNSNDVIESSSDHNFRYNDTEDDAATIEHKDYEGYNFIGFVDANGNSVYTSYWKPYDLENNADCIYYDSENYCYVLDVYAVYEPVKELYIMQLCQYDQSTNSIKEITDKDTDVHITPFFEWTGRTVPTMIKYGQYGYNETEEDENGEEYEVWIDYYDYLQNKIISNTVDGTTYYYICLAFLKDIDNLPAISKDGYEMDYYVYSSTKEQLPTTQYCYDMSNLEGSIKLNSYGNKYMSNGLTGYSYEFPTRFEAYYPGGYFITMWRENEYILNLSTVLSDNGNSNCNNGYITVEVEKGTNYQAYILNYELISGVYKYKLYSLTKQQFKQYTTYYAGWENLDLPYSNSTQIIVKQESTVEIKVFDQSKDHNADNMIGYRLSSVNIKNSNNINSDEILPNVSTNLTYGGENYITSDAYTTTINLKNVALPNHSSITFQAVMSRIKYNLTVKVNDEYNFLNITHNNNNQIKKYTKLSIKDLVIFVSDEINLEFLATIGFEIDCWKYKNVNVGESANYSVSFIPQFLRDNLYASGYYSVAEQQDLGEIVAQSKLIKFDIDVTIFDINSGETYPFKPGLVDITKSNEKVNYFELFNQYIISLNPEERENYTCYSYLTFDFAILKMYILGNQFKYFETEYDFPTDYYESIYLDLTQEMLGCLVIYNPYLPVAQNNRKINLVLEVSKILEVSVVEDDDLQTNTSQYDILKGKRELRFNDIPVAVGEEGEYVKRNSSYSAFVCFGGSVKIGVNNFAKTFYQSAIITVSDETEETILSANSAFYKNDIKENIFVNVCYQPKSYNFSMEVKYKNNYYGFENFKDIKNLSGVSILNSYPKVVIKGSDGSLRNTAFYYNDVMILTFGIDNFNNEVCNIDENGEKSLIDFGYRIIVNGNPISSITDDYTARFVKDMYVVVEIFDSDSNNVYVQSNLTNVGDVYAVTKQGFKENISNKTGVIGMLSGDELKIYFKLNIGYNFVGYIYNNQSIMPLDLNTQQTGEFAGYKVFNLITNYNNTKSGVYFLNFEYIDISVEFKNVVKGEETNNVNAVYSADKDNYNITDSAIISIATQNTNLGYKFVGFSLNKTDILDEGASQISVDLIDHSNLILESGYKLIVYATYINQYYVKVNIEDEDFAQTDIKLYQGKNPIININSNVHEIKTDYMDENSSEYKLVVKTKDTYNYYFNLYVKDDDFVLITDDLFESIGYSKNGNFNSIEFKFVLDKNYEFKVEYLPESYLTNITECCFNNITDLNKFNANGTLPSGEQYLDVVGKDNVSSKQYVDVKVVALDVSNRYNTWHRLTLTIQPKNETGAYLYQFFELRVNNKTIDVKMQEIDENGQKILMLTYDYILLDTTNIEILYKDMYEIKLTI